MFTRIAGILKSVRRNEEERVCSTSITMLALVGCSEDPDPDPNPNPDPNPDPDPNPNPDPNSDSSMSSSMMLALVSRSTEDVFHFSSKRHQTLSI